MTQISQRELRNDSGEVLRRVERGESLVVTRRGVPIADLVPHDFGNVTSSKRASHFTKAAEVIAAFADLPPVDVAAYLADIRDADDFVDEDDRDVWS